MIILVVGRPDSGKSKIAEDLVLELSKEGRRIYIATMIPFGDEGQKRIAKHRKLREGKGFETVECPVNLRSIDGLSHTTGLLECVSNLVGNEMHEKERLLWEASRIADLVTDEIKWLCGKAENLVIVTNEFEKEEGFDEDTLKYIETTRLVNEALRPLADRVVEV